MTTSTEKKSQRRGGYALGEHGKIGFLAGLGTKERSRKRKLYFFICLLKHTVSKDRPTTVGCIKPEVEEADDVNGHNLQCF